MDPRDLPNSIDDDGIRINFITKTRTLLISVQHCFDYRKYREVNFTLTMMAVKPNIANPLGRKLRERLQRLKNSITNNATNYTTAEKSWKRLYIAFVEVPLMVLGCILYYTAIRCCYKIHVSRNTDRRNRRNNEQWKHWHFGRCYCEHCPHVEARRQRRVSTISNGPPYNLEPLFRNPASGNDNITGQRTRSPSSPTISSCSNNEQPPSYETVVRYNRSQTTSELPTMNTQL